MRLLALVIAAFCVALVQGEAGKCVTDMVFLVDQSSSITHTNYKNTILPFLSNLVDGLTIEPNGDHVALVPISDLDLTEVSFHLSAFTNKEDLINAIYNEEFRGGNTATTKALDLSRDSVFNQANGARTHHYTIDVAPTMVIITDGIATDNDPADAAAALRADGVAIFAVKVGSLIKEDYLARITGDPNRVYSADSYAQLTQELAETIIAATSKCRERNGIIRQA